jgi:glucose-6-phosphate isomerase
MQTPSTRDLVFDYNGVMEFAIGEHGIAPSRLDSLREPVAALHQEILAERDRGVLGFMRLPRAFERDPAERARLQATADRLASLGDRHVVLGIGGSYLGTRMLADALLPHFWNERDRAARGGRPRLHFEGNSLDTDALAALRDLLREEVKAGGYTLNVISKSGGTTETAVVFRILLNDAVGHFGEAEAARRVVATTGKETRLHKLAQSRGFESFFIPDNVGGRYSVLSPVGLLPAAVLGIDIDALLAGAAAMAAACETPELRENPAYLYAALQFLAYREKGYSISVMSVWDMALESFGMWYDQLSAESLGKNELGRTPLTSVNTRDLHSRGQQHQQGARDKLITNLFVERPARDPIPVPPLPGNPDQLDDLVGRPIHDLLRVAGQATNFAYTADGRPSVEFRLGRRDPFVLGELIYLFELATVMEGKLLGVNPLDQPGVEGYKNAMFGILGRPGYEAHANAFAARQQPLPDFVWGNAEDR